MPTQPGPGAGRGRAVSRGGPPSKGKGKGKNKGKGRGSPPTTRQSTSSGTAPKKVDKDTCLLCGEQGHRARECPNRGNGETTADRRRAFNSFVGALEHIVEFDNF
eukprot:9037892-Pyramimonas_sp.AAC.1